MVINNIEILKLMSSLENVVEVCGPLGDMFDDLSLPKVDPNWSVLETVSVFEDAIGRSSHFKSHTSKNGLTFVMGLTNKMKEWIQNRLVCKAIYPIFMLCNIFLLFFYITKESQINLLLFISLQ